MPGITCSKGVAGDMLHPASAQAARQHLLHWLHRCDSDCVFDCLHLPPATAAVARRGRGVCPLQCVALHVVWPLQVTVHVVLHLLMRQHLQQTCCIAAAGYDESWQRYLPLPQRLQGWQWRPGVLVACCCGCSVVQRVPCCLVKLIQAHSVIRLMHCVGRSWRGA